MTRPTNLDELLTLLLDAPECIAKDGGDIKGGKKAFHEYARKHDLPVNAYGWWFDVNALPVYSERAPDWTKGVISYDDTRVIIWGGKEVGKHQPTMIQREDV